MFKIEASRLLFSVCELQVFGYYLQRTLHPIEGSILPIRNIIYGVGSKFTVETSNDVSAVIVDDTGNKFLMSVEKISTLFEEI